MNFYNTLENAKMTLVEMKSALDRYKAKPNPNESYIHSSEKKIAHLSNFITTAEKEFNELNEERDYELANVLTEGIKRGKKEATNNILYGRKNLNMIPKSSYESIRASSKINAMDKWPELF